MDNQQSGIRLVGELMADAMHQPEPIEDVTEEASVDSKAESTDDVKVEFSQDAVQPEIGEGIVIETSPENSQETQPVNPLSDVLQSTLENLNDYMEERSKELDEMVEKSTQKKLTEEEEAEYSKKYPTEGTRNASKMTEEEFNEKYASAKIIIDKTGLGSVVGALGLTDEEHNKLELVDSIQVEMVETVELESLNVVPLRSEKKFKHILDNITSVVKSNIVLPLSGYTAVMKGCSVYELIELFQPKERIVDSFRSKWAVIYSNIESTSLGKMDFNEFLRNTAYADMDMFIFGILCATYQKEDTYRVMCENRVDNPEKGGEFVSCNTYIHHPYKINELLRIELMSERILELIKGAADNSIILENAKAFHEESPVMKAVRFRLPQSKAVVTVKAKSAYDMIFNTTAMIDEMDAADKEKYQAASMASLLIDSIHIPVDGDSANGYYKFKDAVDVIKIIYKLSDLDNKVVMKVINDFNDGLDFEFGLQQVKCPKCGKVHTSVPVDISSILFQKYQQATATK